MTGRVKIGMATLATVLVALGVAGVGFGAASAASATIAVSPPPQPPPPSPVTTTTATTTTPTSTTTTPTTTVPTTPPTPVLTTTTTTTTGAGSSPAAPQVTRARLALRLSRRIGRPGRHGATATFTFRTRQRTSGVRYRCALVRLPRRGHAPRARFATCRSPHTVHRLRAGRYRFEVDAEHGTLHGATRTTTFTVR